MPLWQTFKALESYNPMQIPCMHLASGSEGSYEASEDMYVVLL